MVDLGVELNIANSTIYWKVINS